MKARSLQTEKSAKQPLPWPPRGLSRQEAAAYVGVSAPLFDEMVRDGRMPDPKVVDGLRLWDRAALEDAGLTGLIYVVGFADYIKIGYTKNVAQRVASLEGGLPQKLTVHAVMPGSIRKEFALHARFKKHRLNGEWFLREGDLADWVSCLVFDGMSEQEREALPDADVPPLSEEPPK
jgi:excisionase family DNA binding protein